MNSTVVKTRSRRSREPRTTVKVDVGNSRRRGDNIFTVEEILDTRSRWRNNRKGKEYLVKWLNYPSSANSWEKASNILDKKLIKEFNSKHGVGNKDSKSEKTKSKKPVLSTEDVDAEDNAESMDKNEEKKARKGSKRPAVTEEPKAGEEDGEKETPEENEYEDDVFDVEEVQGVRLTKTGKKEYFVKWTNFSADDNTWEPANNIPEGLIAEYEDGKVPKAKKKKSAR